MTLKLTRRNLHKVANEIFETKNGHHHYMELCKNDFEKNGRPCAMGHVIERFIGESDPWQTQFVFASRLSLELDLPKREVHELVDKVINANDRADNYFDRAKRASKMLHALASANSNVSNSTVVFSNDDYLPL